MAKVDLRKTVYNKEQFFRTLGGSEFTTFGVQGLEDIFTVDDFFTQYENLFLSIPTNGSTNSHEYLVRKSSELVGFQRTTEDIQPLLDEIANLRDQLLNLQQENIDLQLGDVNDNKIQDQFNALLEALNQPLPPLPGIILPDGDITDGGENGGGGEGGERSTRNLQPIDDIISVTIAANREISRTSVNVLNNDRAREGVTFLFAGIKDSPKYGKVEVLNSDDGIVQYIPNLRAPSGQKADKFTYVITDGKGDSAIGTVFVNIRNNYLALTQAEGDFLGVNIKVNDPNNPNSSFEILDNTLDVLEDTSLNLEFSGIVSTPRFGRVTATENGIITYIPRIGINSNPPEIDLTRFFILNTRVEPVVEDKFSYRVNSLSDSSDSNIITVTVKVNVLDSTNDDSTRVTSTNLLVNRDTFQQN